MGLLSLSLPGSVEIVLFKVGCCCCGFVLAADCDCISDALTDGTTSAAATAFLATTFHHQYAPGRLA
jgi:hypothetical protein